MTASVVYVDRAGRRTEHFTEALAATAQAIAQRGSQIVGVVPNGGLDETIGVWIFFQDRAP